MHMDSVTVSEQNNAANAHSPEFMHISRIRAGIGSRNVGVNTLNGRPERTTVTENLISNDYFLNDDSYSLCN